MSRIIKCGGYCCDGAQWNYCSYLKDRSVSNEVFQGTYITTELPPICTMFGNTELDQGASLRICNRVYGSSYEGNP